MTTRATAVGLLSLLMLTASETPAKEPLQETPPTATTAQIVYSSFRPAGWDIYHADAPGQPLRRVTDHSALDYDAALSPDGRWVVFTSERRGTPDLHVMDLEAGGPPRLLVDSDAMEDQAAFSPDGQWIAFVGTATGDAEIYLLPFRPDTTLGMDAAVNLTRNPGGDFRPSFSPDGQHIAFSSDRDSELLPHRQFPFAQQRSGDVYLMDRTGGAVRRLTSAPGWDGSPTWSPDGSTIFFYSGRESGGRFRIWAMRPDGSEQRPVSPQGVPALAPALMADGRLAFTTWAGERNERRWHVASVAGGEHAARRETAEALDCLSPSVALRTGALVCHGGEPQHVHRDDFGQFNGPLLVAGTPTTRMLGDREVALQGVRRAFAAPPHPIDGRLVFAAQVGGPSPWLFGYGALALLLLGMVLWGFWLAWRNRGLGTPPPGRRFALAAALSLLALLALLAAAAYSLFSVGSATAAAAVLAVVAVAFLAALGWVVRRLRRADGVYRRVWRYAAVTAATASLAAVYLAALHGRFVDGRTVLREATLDDGAVRDLADLTRLLRYTPRNRQVMGMRWSPDGESVLLTVGGFRTGARAQADIWKLAADGSGPANLTAHVRGNHGHADFSANGRQIVFRSGRSGTFQLYLMNADGSNVRRLTDGPAKKNFPALSPRGDEVVFASDEDGTYYGAERSFEIYTLRIEPDGSAGPVRRITNHPGQSAHPRYSPDGEWVIYTSGKGGINDEEPLVQAVIFAPQMYGEIYAYRLRDGLSIRLTHDRWENGVPFWIGRSE